MSYLRLVFLILCVTLATSNPKLDTFMHCMSGQLGDEVIFKIIQTSNSSSYANLYKSFLHNPRLVTQKTRKPFLIITPFNESQIQSTVLCSRKHGLNIRVRSGGHDYEGLSYLSSTSFVVVELNNLRSIDIDTKDESAWVESGATLGELYYSIAKRSSAHGFPAGVCPTVGVGGHISGGGLGFLMRKFGLASDNILDAHLVDVNGKLLNREAMGENVFWAIRGGGGASFGIITAWKIRLVRVPKTVTGFAVFRSVEDGASNLVSKWQAMADKLPNDLFIRVILQIADANNERKVQVVFQSIFLGDSKMLLALMKQRFPELGLKPQDCVEMSWVQSILFINWIDRSTPLEVLLNRTLSGGNNFKAKSDFVREPIPESGLKGIYKRLLQDENSINQLIMEPLGGRTSEIAESALPFPHRKGNLYNIQYTVTWKEGGISASNQHIQWMRNLYQFMKPYVSKNPRAAYVNYRDLDLGVNSKENTSFVEASVWGVKYFKGNFKRLAEAKTEIDPFNFFRNEQSIPPLHA